MEKLSTRMEGYWTPSDCVRLHKHEKASENTVERPPPPPNTPKQIIDLSNWSSKNLVSAGNWQTGSKPDWKMFKHRYFCPYLYFCTRTNRLPHWKPSPSNLTSLDQPDASVGFKAGPEIKSHNKTMEIESALSYAYVMPNILNSQVCRFSTIDSICLDLDNPD